MRNPSLRPIKRACAYKDFQIIKAVHKDMKKKAPDIIRMLKKMNIGVKPLEKTMKWMKIHDEKNQKLIARYYLEQNRDLWKSWVTEEAFRRISISLEEPVKPGE